MTDALNRLLAPVRRRLENMVARAIVATVTDTTKLQTLQLTVLDSETRENCERFQQYGFTSVPKAGAEAVVLFVGGLRDHPLVIAVDDRAYRKGSLQPGECAIYNHEGTYVLLKTGTVVEVNAPMNLVNSAVLKVAGQQVVGPRGGSITPPTAGTTIDVQARAAISSILTALQTHGLIA